MILVDTSVWVDHFRRDNRRLRELLLDDVVLVHPFVVGELGCDNLRQRAAILHYLVELPALPPVEHEEALGFVEAQRLAAAGIGWIDVHLLASAVLGRAALWTLDRRLASVVQRLGLAPPL